MESIRNNKRSPVSLPSGSSRLVKFAPGTHDYPDGTLESLETSRASVRAYLDGPAPVLEHLTEDAPEMKAGELVLLLRDSEDLDLLHRMKADPRKTVSQAAEKRLSALEDMTAGDE